LQVFNWTYEVPPAKPFLEINVLVCGVYSARINLSLRTYIARSGSVEYRVFVSLGLHLRPSIDHAALCACLGSKATTVCPALNRWG
jgi:hypothetical protein